VVAVAQLVESQIVILVVVGSSPIGHPISRIGLGRRNERLVALLLAFKF